MTRVVVVIPAYNVGTWLRETVDSVLSQTHRDLLAVVIDDGSTDDCVRTLDEIRDERLIVRRQDNAGVSAARNHGRRAFEGDVYAFLDADDIWYPTKIERSLPLLDEFVVVGSRMQYLGEDGAPMRAATGISPLGHETLDQIRRAELLPFPLSSMLIRADALGAAGDFDTDLKQSEDLDLLARLATVGAIGWIDEALGGYRLRATSVSAERQDEQRMYWRYVMARRAARLGGDDLDLGTFQAGYRIAAGERWRDRSAALYREGGLRVANRRWSGALLLLAASLRSPTYAVPRLIRQAR